MENLSAEKDTLTEQVTALSASEADVQALTQENQELQTSNDALTEEVASLQATVETLEAEVETLRAGQPEATEEMVASAKGFTAGEVTVRVTMDQGVIATLTVETPNELRDLAPAARRTHSPANLSASRFLLRWGTMWMR